MTEITSEKRDGLTYVRMTDASREEYTWDNDIPGPSNELVYHEFELANRKRVFVTMAALRAVSRDELYTLSA